MHYTIRTMKKVITSSNVTPAKCSNGLGCKVIITHFAKPHLT